MLVHIARRARIPPLARSDLHNYICHASLLRSSFTSTASLDGEYEIVDSPRIKTQTGEDVQSLLPAAATCPPNLGQLRSVEACARCSQRLAVLPVGAPRPYGLDCKR